ncbi:MAG: hypothetical protein KJO30_05475 [Boseongicola sp.]|nr:hypothetical protein [Boseongicola sp.]NNJ67486.1 hypothetical protein [Boseongicola sp.]
MKTKILLATLALAVTPSLALAMGCGFGHAKTETASISCAEGSVYNAEAQRCVPTTS